jgi:hypothetical protein
LIEPMILNEGNGQLRQYGRGEYWFDSATAYGWWVMAHCRDGKPENDDVVYSRPGPPVKRLPSLTGPTL